MQTGDIEAVQAAMAAWLASSALTDALDRVNAEKNDGHVTPPFAKVYPSERAIPETYPCAQVVGIDETYDPDADDKDGAFRIAVIVGVVGDTEERITRDVQRLVRAARDALWRTVLDGSVGLKPMHVEGVDYGELTAVSAEGPLLKAARLRIKAETISV